MSAQSVLVIGAGFVGARLAGLVSSFGQSVTLIDKGAPPFRVGELRNEGMSNHPGTIDFRQQEVELGSAFDALLSEGFDQLFWCLRPQHAGRQLLERLTRTDAPNTCYVSSLAVYGNTGESPSSESTPAQPTTGYGRDKLAEERIVLERAGNLVVRPAGLYGIPKSPGRLSRSAEPIWQAVKAAAGRDRPPILRFREEIDQYLFLDDLCVAMVDLVGASVHDIVNVGPGVMLTPAQVCEQLAGALGIVFEHEIDLDGPPTALLDTSLLMNALPRLRIHSLESAVPQMLREVIASRGRAG